MREITGMTADIRWPNDLLLNDKKFAGILTEMSSEASKVHHAVIGVGVNVNQQNFPPELKDNATSLCLEGGREFSRLEVAAALIRALDREYRALLRAMSSPIRTPALRGPKGCPVPGTLGGRPAISASPHHPASIPRRAAS